MNTNTHKKNGFLTLCCACIPGAGQMYQGFLKRGTSILLLFSVVIGIATCLNMEFLLFLVPAIWCYSFFDTWNIHNMPDERFGRLQDAILFTSGTDSMPQLKLGNYRTPAAIILILIGINYLLNNIADALPYFGIPYFNNPIHIFCDLFPQYLLSIAIIWLGIHLITSKKQELDREDDSLIPDSTAGDGVGKGEPS